MRALALLVLYDWGVILVLNEWESVARRLLDAFVAPAFAAYGNIAIVATDFNLVTLFNEITVGVDTCVYDCFVPASTSRFDFVDSVGYFKQTSRAFEMVGLEVGAQSVAYYV